LQLPEFSQKDSSLPLEEPPLVMGWLEQKEGSSKALKVQKKKKPQKM